jgi:hypothetical protein
MVDPAPSVQAPAEYRALGSEVAIDVVCPRCGTRMGGPLVGSVDGGVRLWGDQRRYALHESGDLEGSGKMRPGAYFANRSTVGLDDLDGVERGRASARRVEWGCRGSCGFGPHVVDRVTADAAFRLAAHQGLERMVAGQDI